jgi:DNA-binding NarL/FixJ family response regulator
MRSKPYDRSYPACSLMGAVLTGGTMDSDHEPAVGYGPDKVPVAPENTHATNPAPNGEFVNISVVSNSLLLREGLPVLLAAYMPLVVVVSYSGSPLPTTSMQSPPRHVVLLDASIGEEAAVAWTRFLVGMVPAPQVVVLELVNNFDAILACIEAGASGYALRSASVEEVVAIIQQTQRDQAHTAPEITAALFSRLSSYSASARRIAEGSDHPLAPLTPRELEVLQLIAQDFSNQDIAGRLAVEVRTVNQHVRNMLGKLSLQNHQASAGVGE